MRSMCDSTGPNEDLYSLLQDLQCTLHRTRAELRAKEEALKEVEAERLSVAQEKDRSIAQLNHSLREKERQLQVTPTPSPHHILHDGHRI